LARVDLQWKSIDYKPNERWLYLSALKRKLYSNNYIQSTTVSARIYCQLDISSTITKIKRETGQVGQSDDGASLIGEGGGDKLGDP
jgi:hypothetical protein